MVSISYLIDDEKSNKCSVFACNKRLFGVIYLKLRKFVRYQWRYRVDVVIVKMLFAEALGTGKDIQLDLCVTAQQKVLVASFVMVFMVVAMYLLATVPSCYS